MCPFSFTGEYIQCLLDNPSLDHPSTSISLKPGSYRISSTISVSRTTSISSRISSSFSPAVAVLDGSSMLMPGGPIMSFNATDSTVEAAVLSLKDVSFLNGHAQIGGGLYVRNIETLSLVDCDFNNTYYNCSAQTYCQEHLPYVGGALYSENVKSVNIQGGRFYNNSFSSLKGSITPAGGGCFLNYNNRTSDGIDIAVTATRFNGNTLHAGCNMGSFAPALFYQGAAARVDKNKYGQSLCTSMSNVSVKITGIEATANRNLVGTAPGDHADATCTGSAVAGAVWVRNACNLDGADIDIRYPYALWTCSSHKKFANIPSPLSGIFYSNLATSANPAAGAAALHFSDYTLCPTSCSVNLTNTKGPTVCPVKPTKTSRVKWTVGGTFTHNMCISTKSNLTTQQGNFIATAGAFELSNSGSMYNIAGKIKGNFTNNSAVGNQAYGGAIFAFDNSPSAELNHQDIKTLEEKGVHFSSNDPPGTPHAAPYFEKPIRVNLSILVSDSVFANNSIAPRKELLSLSHDGKVAATIPAASVQHLDSALTSGQACSRVSFDRQLGPGVLDVGGKIGGAGGAIALLQLAPNDPILSDDPTAAGQAYNILKFTDGFAEYYHNNKHQIKHTSFDPKKTTCQCAGGAISFTGSSLTLNRSNLTGNYAGSKGGGVYSTKGTGNLTVIDSILAENDVSAFYAEIDNTNVSSVIAAAIANNSGTFRKDLGGCISFTYDKSIRNFPGGQLAFDSSGGLSLEGAKFKFQGASLSNGGSNTGVSAPVMGKLSVNDATAGSCPPGSKLDMALSSFAFYEPYPFCNPMGTSYIRITCEACQAGTYSLQKGSFAGTHTVSPVRCLPCPLGGNCTQGSDLITPNRNRWGFVKNGTQNEIEFARCPQGYCCQVGGHCDNYSYCAGNRSGILCGQCKLGYCPLVYGTSCVECSTCIVGYQDSPKDGGFLVLCIFLYMLVVTSILFVSTIGYSTTDGSSTLGGFSIILFFYQNLRFVLLANSNEVAATMLSVINFDFKQPAGPSGSGPSGLLARICNPLYKDVAANIALGAVFPFTVCCLFFIYWAMHHHGRTPTCLKNLEQRMKKYCVGEEICFVDAGEVSELCGISRLKEHSELDDQNPIKSTELHDMKQYKATVDLSGVEFADCTVDYTAMHDGDVKNNNSEEKQSDMDQSLGVGALSGPTAPSDLKSRYKRTNSSQKAASRAFVEKAARLKNRSSKVDRRVDRVLTYISPCCCDTERHSKLSVQFGTHLRQSSNLSDSGMQTSDLRDSKQTSDLNLNDSKSEDRLRRPTLDVNWRVANATKPPEDADMNDSGHTYLADAVQSVTAERQASQGLNKKTFLFEVDPFPILGYKITLFLFNSIAATAFRAVNCVNIDGHLRLFIDGQVECWESKVWWQWLAMIIICFGVVPFPLYLILVRNHLRAICNESNVLIIQTQLQALEGGFQARQLHFESWIFAHRLIILFSFEFIESTYVKSIAIAFEFVVVAVHVLWARPYKTRISQVLANLISISLAIMAILNIKPDDDSSSVSDGTDFYTREVIQGIIIVLVTIYICIVLLPITVGRRMLSERYPKLERYLLEEHVSNNFFCAVIITVAVAIVAVLIARACSQEFNLKIVSIDTHL